MVRRKPLTEVITQKSANCAIFDKKNGVFSLLEDFPQVMHILSTLFELGCQLVRSVGWVVPDVQRLRNFCNDVDHHDIGGDCKHRNERRPGTQEQQWNHA